MPQATPLVRHHASGKLVSHRNQSGESECSGAASALALRKATSATQKILAKCRQMAHTNRQTLKKQGAGKVAPGRSTFQRGEKAAGLKQSHAERIAAKAAQVKATPDVPEPKPFGLKQESAAGRKAPGSLFENAGAGRTGKLFDMKRGDLPGQTSLLDQVPAVDTHPKATALPPGSASTLPGGTRKPLTPEQIAKAVAEVRQARGLDKPEAGSASTGPLFAKAAAPRPSQLEARGGIEDAIRDYQAAPDAGKLSAIKERMHRDLSGAQSGLIASNLLGKQAAYGIARDKGAMIDAVHGHLASRLAPKPAPPPKPPRPDRLASLAGKLIRHREAMANRAATPGSKLHNRNVEVYGRGRQLAETGKRVGEELRKEIMGKGLGTPPASIPSAPPAGQLPAPASPRAPQLAPASHSDQAKLSRFQTEIRALRASPDASKLHDLHERMNREVNGWEAEALANRTLGHAARSLPADRTARLDAIRGHLVKLLPAGAMEGHTAALAAKRKAAEEWQAGEKKRITDEFDARHKATIGDEPFGSARSAAAPAAPVPPIYADPIAARADAVLAKLKARPKFRPGPPGTLDEAYRQMVAREAAAKILGRRP